MNKKAKGAIFLVLILSLILVVGLVTAKPGARAVKACNDKIDNDNDGYTDWPDDPGCSSRQDNSELNPNVECDDGNDNDGDSNIDMNDNGCSSPSDNDETNCGDSVCEGGEVCDVCIVDCGHCDSCSDTDGGNIIDIFGTTSGYLNDIFYSNDDYCVDTSNIMEYYCSGNYEQSQQQSCGTDSYGSNYCSAGDEIYRDLTDYFCSGGACDSTIIPEFVEDCDDNDGYGSNYCSAGDTVYVDYYNYYCSGGACDYAQTPEFVEDCDNYDSYSSNYCYLGDVYRDFYNYYCMNGGCNLTFTPELVQECDYGCTNGVCDQAPDSCSDTDSGWDFEVQGTVSGFNSGNPYSYGDVCLNSTFLSEKYCSGTNPSSVLWDCELLYFPNFIGYCLNGACVHD